MSGESFVIEIPPMPSTPYPEEPGPPILTPTSVSHTPGVIGIEVLNAFVTQVREPETPIIPLIKPVRERLTARSSRKASITIAHVPFQHSPLSSDEFSISVKKNQTEKSSRKPSSAIIPVNYPAPLNSLNEESTQLLPPGKANERFPNTTSSGPAIRISAVKIENGSFMRHIHRNTIKSRLRSQARTYAVRDEDDDEKESNTPPNSSRKKSEPPTSCFGNLLSFVRQRFVRKRPTVRENLILLPPISEHDSGKKCLVLDLDETLVHSVFQLSNIADFFIDLQLTPKMIHRVFVHERPFIQQFLEEMDSLYEIIIFTASVATYASPVIDRIDPDEIIRHRLYRESCVHLDGNFVKDLSVLGRPLKDIIIIDNSPHCYSLQPGNAIPCLTWFSDKDDTEFLQLIPILKELARADDVRIGLDEIAMSLSSYASTANFLNSQDQISYQSQMVQDVTPVPEPNLAWE